MKSIYCVKHTWYDAEGKPMLPRVTRTHQFFSSYRRAVHEFAHRQEIIYCTDAHRRIEPATPDMEISADDGTYELLAVLLHYGAEGHVLRISLCAVDLS